MASGRASHARSGSSSTRSDVEAIEANAAQPCAPAAVHARAGLGPVRHARTRSCSTTSPTTGSPAMRCWHVLRLADGSGLLVNRGWMPFTGYRDRLPDVSIRRSAESRAVTRPAVHLACAGHRLGAAAAGKHRLLAATDQLSRARRYRIGAGREAAAGRCCCWMRARAPVIFATGSHRESRRTAISAMHSSGGCSRCWRWVCLSD